MDLNRGSSTVDAVIPAHFRGRALGGSKEAPQVVSGPCMSVLAGTWLEDDLLHDQRQERTGGTVCGIASQLILSAIFIDPISDLHPSFVTGQGLLFIMGMSVECQCNKHKTNKSMIFVFRGCSRQASSSWPDRYRQANSRTFRLTVERRQRSMCCDDMTSPPVFWWSSRSTQGPKDDASPDFMPFL